MSYRPRVMVLLALVVVGCTKSYNGGELLLEWHDATANVTFRVTRHPSLLKQNNEFYVERSGRVEQVRIDDDATFRELSFVRLGDWLLVLSDNEVWAGYDCKMNALYGEGQWEKLPFTVRRSSGVVVASKKVSAHSHSPANFPRIPEGGESMPAASVPAASSAAR